jgi:hypothetical protein
MQTSQREPRATIGYTCLINIGIKAVFSERRGAKRSREEASLIFDLYDFEDKASGQRSFQDFQRRISQTIRGSGIGTMNFPPQSRIDDICAEISASRFHGRMRT